jgi:hypothetical protein
VTCMQSASSRPKADLQYIIRNMAAYEAPDGDIGNKASRKHNASSMDRGPAEEKSRTPGGIKAGRSS